MQDINEKLESLEQDGKQYAHFLSHPGQPGYYGIMIREHTPEYVSVWLPYGSLAGYKLELSIEMPDDTFCDYISELFPTQKPVHVLQKLYAITTLTPEVAQTWANDFKEWKQEKIRLNRVKWLSQYPWVTKGRIQEQEISVDNN